MQTTDIIIIGAGAAGIAAGRRLQGAGASFVILEARDRIGGRGWTRSEDGEAIDIGCEWLHSANHNVWRAEAETLGFDVIHTPSPWMRQSGSIGSSAEDQASFGAAFGQFEARLHARAEIDPPHAASVYLEAGSRWNPLLDAVFTYISGAELDRIDARDYARYEDTGLNWRVREGYGALMQAYGAGLPIELETPVLDIDHSGARVRVTTTRGVIEATQIIIAVPTSILAKLKITPDLPDVREAAEGLPLGTAEKVFFKILAPEAFPADGHVFSHIDRVDIGSYHLRPLGRPLIESYFGGTLARRLAEAGQAAMIDFAAQELTGLLGAKVRTQISPLACSHWAIDPYALGSYSYAKPGCAEMRAVLAQPHAERLFFAGEACSRERYSTAHGAFETGVAAAELALSARQG
ncbi:MAG: NAD(P)/FAD-dependent oxidoreductase [Alphaproteobacteria bacterium]